MGKNAYCHATREIVSSMVKFARTTTTYVSVQEYMSDVTQTQWMDHVCIGDYNRRQSIERGDPTFGDSMILAKRRMY